VGFSPRKTTSPQEQPEPRRPGYSQGSFRAEDSITKDGRGERGSQGKITSDVARHLRGLRRQIS